MKEALKEEAVIKVREINLRVSLDLGHKGERKLSPPIWSLVDDCALQQN